MKSCNVVIDANTFFFWAVIVLILPLKWVVAFFLASLWHEIFHYVALYLMDTRPSRIHIGVNGVKMEIPELSFGQECFCALAGPFGGLLLLAVCRWYPQLSICALLQSLYNLLPLYPLDGGRALRCFAESVLPDHADTFCLMVEWVVLTGILLTGICLKLVTLTLFFSFILAGKMLRGKIPCKPTKLRVQ